METMGPVQMKLTKVSEAILIWFTWFMELALMLAVANIQVLLPYSWFIFMATVSISVSARRPLHHNHFLVYCAFPSALFCL
jgi:hypothetical protein